MQTLEITFPEAQDARRALLDVPEEELLSWLQARGQAPLRIRQMRRWLLGGRATSFEQMSDLPGRLREELAAEFHLLGSEISRHLVSCDGTHKLLLRLRDGQVVECVLLPEARSADGLRQHAGRLRHGLRLLRQRIGGVVRNLTAGEILEQLIHARNLLPPEERLTNIVVMGMGEPLANLDALLEALAVASSPKGLGIGARHITISTVGLPAKIRRLADLGKQYHLAVSLHAPNDELRNQDRADQRQDGLVRHPRSGRLFLRDHRPAGDV